jgi:hypothetical protein
MVSVLLELGAQLLFLEGEIRRSATSTAPATKNTTP